MRYHFLVDRYRLLRQIAQHPNAVRYDDLAQLLTAFGFEERPSRRGTSHHYWVRGVVQISVPYRRPHVKPHYVRVVLALLEDEDGD
jgi:hypothetical protein